MNKIVSIIFISCIPLYCLHAIDVHFIIGARRGEKLNIGLVNFLPPPKAGQPRADGDRQEEIQLAEKIRNVLRHDLLFTRYFNIIESEIPYTGKKEELIDWQNYGTEVLVTAKVRIHKEKCFLSAVLYDTSSGDIIYKKKFSGKTANYRKLAHKLNDKIILIFTGVPGIAQSKIAFVNNSTGHKEIYAVDYDGFNLTQLTDDRSINLFPRWSPDGKKIIFTTYKYGNPDLYIMNSDGTNKRSLATYQGLNVAACWAPDSRTILLTLSRGATPNIYQISLTGKIIRRITRSGSINTSPWFSPNNREIVFVSGRAGYPQMYITNLEGGNIKRLYTDGYSDSPAWSSRGNKIAFSMRYPGRYFFDIFCYDIVRGIYYPLTQDSGSNENPTFSPDGQHIVFTSTRNKRRELFQMAIDGSSQFRLGNIPKNSFCPHWSR